MQNPTKKLEYYVQEAVRFSLKSAITIIILICLCNLYKKLSGLPLFVIFLDLPFCRFN